MSGRLPSKSPQASGKPKKLPLSRRAGREIVSKDAVVDGGVRELDVHGAGRPGFVRAGRGGGDVFNPVAVEVRTVAGERDPAPSPFGPP